MPKRIAILEDNEDRRVAMQTCLADMLPEYEIRFFDDAGEMIAFLEGNLSEISLISLDHDLELKPDRFGKLIDPGTGRDVADYLARKSAVCPVVVASTNSLAATGMKRVLRDADWQTHRVVPFDDLNWIRGEWSRTVGRIIMGRRTKRMPQKRQPGSRP